MEDQIYDAIQQKLADGTSTPFPDLIRRDVTVPSLAGKAHAVIGMRRAGKTSFLHQCLADRLVSGIERERLVYFNFEDERLGGLAAGELGTVVEEYYREFPQFRRAAQVTWCFDEIQVVPGWERFVRRLLDSENVEVFLSGSSARMLSREVATSMRGRALETIVTPYSYREFLRSRSCPVRESKRLLNASDRSTLVAAFDDYITIGGFPEAGLLSETRDRITLLQGYVDSVLLRDVMERHGVSNIVALRAFVRQLIRHPASTMSVSKIHADFRSRGISASKETLLSFLAYLEDAFLVFTLPLACRSERRRQVHPRKLYLADHGLAQAFSPAAHLDRGHLIENVVACELARQSRDLAYVKTQSGFEVDFLAIGYDGTRRLIQVTADASNATTRDRETLALIEARAEFPDADLILLAETIPSNRGTPENVTVEPVWRWLRSS